MKPILAYRPLIHAALDTFLAEKEKTISPGIMWGEDFVQRLRPFATAGKLLRGSLLCYSYELFNGHEPPPEVIKAAMALELAHAGLLIHDDIMDQDITRRGLPAVHYQYQLLAEQKKLDDAKHFAESLAICAGDSAVFFAYELLAQTGPQTAQINNLFSKTLATVCMGQMQDMYLEASSAMPTKKEMYAVMEAKTALYSLALPLVMGAILAVQNLKTQKALHTLGMAAGTIFQIRDDELGALGNAAKLGKPVGSDIIEGKKTLLYYYLFKCAKPSERARLKTIFGNPEATAQDIMYAQKLIKALDIPKLLNQQVRRLEGQAFIAISKLPVTADGAQNLRDLVKFCATRQA